MMDDVKSDKPPTTLVLMYSNQLTPAQANTFNANLYYYILKSFQFSRFILEGVNSDVVEDKFTEYGYLRFDTTTQMSLDPTPDFK